MEYVYEPHKIKKSGKVISTPQSLKKWNTYTNPIKLKKVEK